MTTEEMNRDIAVFMGWNITRMGALQKGRGNLLNVTEFKYESSWNELMPVWSKLRGELQRVAYDDKGRCINSDARIKCKHIESYIIEPNITRTHQLIHATIVWLKSK